jgi:UDP-glucose 4-epimerase
MPIAVDDPLNPASPYGLHKKMAEDLCRAYGRHFGVRSALVRLFSIYGVGLRKQLLWDACGKIGGGDPTFGGTGRETRDWLHVEDAAALMLHGAHHASVACPVVNGGTGEATPISMIVNAIAEDLGVDESPRFSGASRPGDPTDYQADISGALAWGWTPTRRWRDEVRAYTQWFKEGAR